ncbi:hypothetical protein WME95_41275 [Sorangium sp. So ce327]|uniref:Uncharacterized protein n=1 Tax=Sorangium cellulosum (strain So ce56) TaxID=448385 RepID=A9F4N0_SORC5|nr:hypothetical protein [Sorangium cellulosum]CAN97725.1 hypothetical protein predicted by Glimmer/Critica [Sorangium cellulosum So ce56]
MKREKRLTKRERKALAPARPAQPHEHKHIHCVACGKHLDPEEFLAQGSATWIQCLHKSRFATCTECVEISKRLLAEHDRTGQPVQSAQAWH